MNDELSIAWPADGDLTVPILEIAQAPLPEKLAAQLRGFIFKLSKRTLRMVAIFRPTDYVNPEVNDGVELDVAPLIQRLGSPDQVAAEVKRILP